MAFVHRADRIHLPLLPWDFFPLSGFYLRSPATTSGAISARAFRLARRMGLQVTRPHPLRQACRWALSGADG